ncbi:hypothetical protein AMTRI_Chr04g181970 [Amborella trichopoda]
MPCIIILPLSNIQLKHVVVCSRRHGWLICARCGGHSYEGFLSTGDLPFVIIDLMNLNKVEVDIAQGTAWIGGGTIQNASKDRYGFPAGTCPTMGSGGHISGGRFGHMSRKFRLVADNILDALVKENSCEFGVDDAHKIMRDRFRSLAISKSICKEMAWIDSMLFFSGLPSGSTREDLLNRYSVDKFFFKAKSDYVKEPLTPGSLEGAITYLEEEPSGSIILYPYGGKMDEIEPDAIPFPHHKGTYILYMEPYVNKSPREAYVNYLDIDLGALRNGTARVETAREWGIMYFKDNFDRLV